MAKIMDPILPIVSILRYWAIILASFGGPGNYIYIYMHIFGCLDPFGLGPPWMAMSYLSESQGPSCTVKGGMDGFGHTTPRFPVKGSLKGDIDMDIYIYLDLQKSQNNGPESQNREYRQYRAHSFAHFRRPGRA